MPSEMKTKLLELHFFDEFGQNEFMQVSTRLDELLQVWTDLDKIRRIYASLNRFRQD